MQILFVHPNFPAQFGPVLTRLGTMPDVEPVFVSRTGRGDIEGVRRIRYSLKGGATRANHYCSRTFENAVWQSHAVYDACKADPGLRPDLIVGHSGFGTTIMLRELYDAPIINLFEYYYRPHGSDMDFRPDFPPREIDYLRARMRNAMILLDLEECDAGYSPTAWQRDLLPSAYRHKVRAIHDGIDTDIWRPRENPSRRLGGEDLPAEARIVTYVSRGFEAMRGFDIFVKVAHEISRQLPDVLFVCVGTDRVSYGNDLRHIQTRTLREHVFREVRPDPERFRFPGRLAPEKLAELLSLSDLHLYLTVPFVLSWSMLDALACECLVLASDTPPVREFLSHGENGLLGDFFDVEGLARQAVEALEHPERHRELRRRGRRLIEERYSLDRSFDALWALFQDVAAGGRRAATGEG